jgi:DNA gyrase subunit A
VVTRRTKYDLKKAEERDHILQGLLIALDNIDEVIKIMRSSKTTQEAKDRLIERFGLTEIQAQAIADMRLRQLTGLESEKIEAEHQELLIKIKELKEILADKKVLLGVIKKEMQETADKYGDDRRTKIGFDDDDISIEDMITDENVVIAMTNLGYIKRMTMDNFHTQNRGGKGIKGMSTIQDDYIEDLLMTNTHNDVMFFTNMGRVYRLKAYEIPEAGRTARGTAIINLLQLNPEEKISAMIPLTSVEEDKNLLFITKKGIIKKTSTQEFLNIRKNGLIAINISDDDELIDVKTTDRNNTIFIVTKEAMCIQFKETDVRTTGRNTMGVKAIELAKNDEVVGMQIDTQGDSLLLVTENGIGKRTTLDKFRLQKRGGKGLRCYKITDKTGTIVGVKAVNDEHEIMMITTEGIIIQIRMSDIRELGRITTGVKLMNLDDDVKIAKIAKVREKVQDDNGMEVDLPESDEDDSEYDTESEDVENTDDNANEEE